MSIYLDYNASTPIDDRVLTIMINTYRNDYGNADSRTHDYGNNAKLLVETAREQVASILNISKNEVIFTSGATESDNLAIIGMAEYGNKNKRRHIITTAIEHKAVLEPMKYLLEQGFEVDFIRPDSSGRVNVDEVMSKVRPETLLVSVMHANNETGIIQPIYEIGNELKSTETYFHIDAAQSFGKLVDDLQKVQYDLLSCTAHKIYGPQGIGALITRIRNNKRPPIKPIIYGGGHESGLRPGTLPVALIVGFGKACEIAESEYNDNYSKYEKSKNDILKMINDSGVKFEINGDQQYCMPNTLNISFTGIDSEALMMRTKEFCSISNGSACTSHDYSLSHVLTAMGVEKKRIESSIRISYGRKNVGRDELDRFILFIKESQ